VRVQFDLEHARYCPPGGSRSACRARRGPGRLARNRRRVYIAGIPSDIRHAAIDSDEGDMKKWAVGVLIAPAVLVVLAAGAVSVFYVRVYKPVFAAQTAAAGARALEGRRKTADGVAGLTTLVSNLAC